ncbi:bifunctional endoribonuclease/protein kinase ire1 [Neocucurbitaria cava]|uniref:non-specific serine/threonine protein kinase n=1 Tax=Neocucurbitaria cava TaxID=798079 RepID=A0A9W8Y9D1_9PLEO|nr:bifunctional endoribonuclease/protein kinase ire1 [Neocucurbitaria cava]
MPRPRRPPGAGPALTILALLFLPSLLVAAQQQQPLGQHARSKSSRAEARVEDAHLVPPHHQPSGQEGGVGVAAKRRPALSLLAHDESAVATKVSSAPAITAVRAHPGRNAASGALIPSARSLHDWEVEDFVLLATVDGHIHARDRYNGEEIWELAGKPMLETIYNVSEGRATLQDQPFVWIVEPREDGALYVLTPGPYPVLQSLGLTVKQLTDIAPYSSDDPELPVVWNVEKKTFMLLVDAASGIVKQSFSPGGMFANDDSCAPESKNFFNPRERDCRGIIDIGQTEYTITIHNKKTNEHLCTIKYAEWNPNSRDKDLQSQYVETMDKQYVYSRYNGEVIAYDHKRPRWHQRPLFKQPLPYPVARVFDVARPTHDESAEPPLVLLPQPAGPAFSEEMANRVLLNTTETGAWYALSEVNYPAVTDGAPDASCYMRNDLLDWDAPYSLPDKKSLVGVHKLDYRVEHQSSLRAIAAPTYYPNGEGQVVSMPPKSSPMEHQHATIDPPPPTFMESKTFPRYWVASFLTFVIIASCVASYKQSNIDLLRSYWHKYIQPSKAMEPYRADPAADQSVAESVHDKEVPLPDLDVAIPSKPTQEPVEQSGAEASNVPDLKEKKVTFDIPEEDDADLSPLSRTTTADPNEDEVDTPPTGAPSGEEQSTGKGPENANQDPNAPATPKKKKTHRGKRGGRKLNRNQAKDDDEVGRIVDAARQLEVGPPLHPDEVFNGDDIQDISNIKRIGKLTIDQDKLLGNGSGGTFVFEGKWNEREVAVKRMLPQYFGLAEQEVKLLQESDLHPNVIRYFDDEKDENFLYIAVELCQASLFDLYKDGRPGEELTEAQQRLVNDINANARHALYQLANGLNHLHSLRIIHRDIKPQNILIAHPQKNKTGTRLVISDFGLCKTLPDNVSTLIGTTGNAGTVGWKAPELISQPKELANGSSTGISRDSSSSTDPVAQGVKRAVDIFSLGCVFFYVLTNGCHPFDDDEGWMQIREYNIKKEKANLKQLRLGDDSEEPYHLIQWMLKTRPEDRPTAVQVMNHPFFWSDEKRLTFLCDCSDHWEREPRDPPSDYLARLEDYSYEVLDHKRNFLAKLDHSFINSLGKQRKYTGDRMLDLLRALRNKKNHYEDMDEAVKAKVGPLPSGYLRYWTTKFPTLLMSCYECVLDCGLQSEPRFRPYFEGQTM